MTLQDYLARTKTTPEEFAAKIGASRGGVLKWISGERFPRPVMLKKIKLATGGKVQANDFT